MWWCLPIYEGLICLQGWRDFFLLVSCTLYTIIHPLWRWTTFSKRMLVNIVVATSSCSNNSKSVITKSFRFGQFSQRQPCHFFHTLSFLELSMDRRCFFISILKAICWIFCAGYALSVIKMFLRIGRTKSNDTERRPIIVGFLSQDSIHEVLQMTSYAQRVSFSHRRSVQK